MENSRPMNVTSHVSWPMKYSVISFHGKFKGHSLNEQLHFYGKFMAINLAMKFSFAVFGAMECLSWAIH